MEREITRMRERARENIKERETMKEKVTRVQRERLWCMEAT